MAFWHGEPYELQLAGSRGDFAVVVKKYIDEELGKMRAGRTSSSYQGHSDADLMMELMARGYAVWKPPVGE